MAGTEDDDIDAETLQAQVEMSMAYTQELVSSWMKNSTGKLPSSKSRRDEEKELEEYMRRPPRLGVGAAVPESASMLGRDAARLKNTLTGKTGKKRAREEEKDVVIVPSDDEEESRASAVRKKATVDPFGPRSEGKGKKTKKGQVNGLPSPAELPSAGKEKDSHEHAESSKSVIADVPDAHIHQTPDSPRKKKKKKHAKTEDDSIVDPMVSPPAKLEKSPVRQVVIEPGPSSLPNPHTKKSTNKSLKNTDASVIVVPDSPYKNISHEQRPSSSNASSIPPPRTSPSKNNQQPIPLLNLDGPPEGPDNSSPKKKRKRRKKKKSVAADEDSVIELDQ
ncbi:hypothetical protein B0H21DRAFT_755328 [Amylocystis lapponica]|nr:hypothetical protein B0H21DRAFT_755328 [Amylocystis lapponica]